MTVIAHYVVYDLNRPKRAHLALRDAEEAQQYREAGFTVEGPFVHKDQLTGAVSLTEFERDALLTLVDGIANDDGIDTYGLSGAQKAAIGRARTKLRGQ